MSANLVDSKLSNQPLTLVLTEFRFSPILKIADHIPDLQESYRQLYPVFSTKQTQTTSLSQNILQVTTKPSWLFISEKQNKAIEVTHNQLIFFSTQYNRFPNFCDEAIKALKILEGIVKPSLLEKIGLRYNDIVSPSKEESLSKYLEPEFFPPHGLESIEGKVINNRTETVIETNDGILAVRTLTNSSGQTVMPDLLDNSPVKIHSNTIQTGQLNTILDFDHSWTAAPPGIRLSLETAKNRLHNLHKDAKQAFFNIVTDEATETWK